MELKLVSFLFSIAEFSLSKGRMLTRWESSVGRCNSPRIFCELALLFSGLLLFVAGKAKSAGSSILRHLPE